MPRPHIPSHLSLQRIKSSTGGNRNGKETPHASTVPATPPTNGRSSSPPRDYFTADSLQKNGNEVKSGDHKGMGLMLRVQVLKATNLAPKDKSGTSDPYLVLALGDCREATSVAARTLNPEWNETYEFPIVTADSALLEAVCWDKDRFRKEYMGEFDVVLDELFEDGTTTPEAKWFRLRSRRARKKMRRKKKDKNVTGEVLLKFTLYDPTNPAATSPQILQKYRGVVADPMGDDDEDDAEMDELLTEFGARNIRGDASDEEGDDDDDDEDENDQGQSADETDEDIVTPGVTVQQKTERRRKRRLAKLRRRKKEIKGSYAFGGMSDVAGVLFLEISRIIDLPPERNSTRTTFDMDPFVVTSLGRRTYRTRVVNHNLNPVYDEKLVFQVSKSEVNYSLSFAVVDRDKFSGNDFVGTTTFPLSKVQQLTPEADSDTGLYRLPDPEALTATETERQNKKKKWPMSRTTSQYNLSRSSSNNNLPKLNRTTSNTSLRGDHLTPGTPSMRPGLKRTKTEDEFDYFSSNSGERRPPPTSAPSYTSALTSVDTHASQNGGGQSDDPDLISFELPLDLKKKERWQDKHHPVLYIKAKYLPYRALRQQFWRAMLKQYDADESGTINKTELVTMLDTLGSTLHNSTIDGMFARWAGVNNANEIDRKDGRKTITMDQAVICLEEQLMKSRDAQSQLHRPHWDRSASARTNLRALNPLAKDQSSSSSPDHSPGGSSPQVKEIDSTRHPQQAARIPSGSARPHSTHIDYTTMLDVGETQEPAEADTDQPPTTPSATLPIMTRSESLDSEAELHDDETTEEHVVEIQECPICHMPRIAGRGKRSPATDGDIITHIATCASSDWRAVNNLVMAGFVTSSQAQRKWYSKVVTKIGYGGYKLGANSANILVQDRTTGMINEERMSVYVRLGIRLMYKGLKSRDMEKRRIRKLLRSMSIKQGKKYDDPHSVSQIAGFINFHQLDMSEVLLSTEQFKHFNEFFYRKLKPDARPCSAPDDPRVIVSPADCRSVVFNQMEDAQRIWVKGREFSIERLLGDAYPEDAKRYKNGSLGICRLAPQDYHRFHIPVDGSMGEPRLIEGEYYTVNPMAIRSALDVYGENVRVCVPIDSVAHGRVMVVCVGAMMVGSTIITRKPGEHVKRAEELGYFKFGGSTLLLLFEQGVMKFDDDLVSNSNGAVETLIRVGMSIGHVPGQQQHAADMPKTNPSAAEKQEAKRRIEGSLAPSRGDNVLPVAAPP